MDQQGSLAKKKFYFMGICGTAMGAVAAALKDLGHDISGSDAAVYPPMSDFLLGKGIRILDGFEPGHVPLDADVIVVGNAMSRGNPEVEQMLNLRLRYLSLPETLKEYFLRGKRNLVISGTHGKTTTTSLVAWCLESAGQNPNFMIGGIPANFAQGSRLGTGSDFVVLEGDEYDTAFFDKRSKFIHYLPEIVAVNNIEFDHADIYGNLEEIKTAFRRMLRVVPGNGLVVVNGDDANCLDVAEGCFTPVVTVGFGEQCARRIENVAYRFGASGFSLQGESYELPMAGEFNVRNAAMAATVALAAGLSPQEVRRALASFKGIARRQEVRGETVRGIRVIDDFGHHPTAMAQTLKAMRQQYPDRKIWALFEPRSNTTRRNVFQEELPAALRHADAVCIASITNHKGVPPDARLDPVRVMDRLREWGREAYHEPDADAIVARLKDKAGDGDLIVVFSNGGFGGIHRKLLEAL